MSLPDEAFWAAVPFGPGVRRLTVDPNGLAAFEKPEGVLSHPNTPRDADRSLVKANYDIDEECFRWMDGSGTDRVLWLVNRLDSATSGLILVAGDGALAAHIRAQFKGRNVEKMYQALVFGRPRQSSETWRDVLDVKRQGGRLRTSVRGSGLPSECRMSLVRTLKDPVRLSLLRLEPRTGRSHQLRVQCARRGLPIVGDQTYGAFAANRDLAKRWGTKRLFLHSCSIAFDYAFGGATRSFTAQSPLPPEFEGAA